MQVEPRVGSFLSEIQHQGVFFYFVSLDATQAPFIGKKTHKKLADGNCFLAKGKSTVTSVTLAAKLTRQSEPPDG